MNEIDNCITHLCNSMLVRIHTIKLSVEEGNLLLAKGQVHRMEQEICAIQDRIKAKYIDKTEDSEEFDDFGFPVSANKPPVVT